MLNAYDAYRNIDMISICLRLLMVLICGGLIGLEREYKCHPVGFRTHILICLGSCITMLTGEYLVLVMHFSTDITRLGAQVISGIGFIGAGAIIVTRGHKVIGLTTAAGLWTSAIIGLAIGIGFYEAALCATAVVLIIEVLFTKLERKITSDTSDVTLFVEYKEPKTLDKVIKMLSNRSLFITSMEINHNPANPDHNYVAVMTVAIRGISPADLAADISHLKDVVNVEEL